MGLSEEFLNGIKDFIQEYKTNANGGWFRFGQDKHYDIFCTNLDGFITILESSKELFSEQAVCDYLNRTALLGTNDNPAFVGMWQRKLQLLSHNLSTLKDPEIAIISQGDVAESIASAVHQVLPVLKKLHQELEASYSKNKKLEEENRRLRADLARLEYLASLSPKLDALQQHVDSMSVELAELRASIVETPKPAPSAPVFVSPPPPTAQKNVLKPTPQKAPTPLSSISFLQELTKEVNKRAQSPKTHGATPEKK